MPKIIELEIRTIDPNEHPHVLLRCLGKPGDGLSVPDAMTRLHHVIADIADNNILADAADKLTNYCVPADTSPHDRFEISASCLSMIKRIRDRENHHEPSPR